MFIGCIDVVVQSGRFVVLMEMERPERPLCFTGSMQNVFVHDPLYGVAIQ